jgi:hypothetical protein
MSNNKGKKSKKDNKNRTIRHGGYSINKPTKIRRYASLVRKALIQDISGGAEADLSAQQIVLIDGVVDMQVICKMMGEYVAEEGIMKGSNLQPCLMKSWLAYKNSISRHLALLGINKKADDMKVTYLEDM